MLTAKLTKSLYSRSLILYSYLSSQKNHAEQHYHGCWKHPIYLLTQFCYLDVLNKILIKLSSSIPTQARINYSVLPLYLAGKLMRVAFTLVSLNLNSKVLLILVILAWIPLAKHMKTIINTKMNYSPVATSGTWCHQERDVIRNVMSSEMWRHMETWCLLDRMSP